MWASAPREDLRQWFKFSLAGAALGLRWLDAAHLILLATILLLLVLIVIPRAGAALCRPDEAREGTPVGLVLYPVTLLLLVVLFWSFGGMPQVAAATWALFACGDATATMVGATWGRRWPLPWNVDKSWLGMIAYFVSGSVAAFFMLAWVGGRSDLEWVGGIWSLSLLVAATAGLCAFLESLPVRRFNDNFWVPLVGSVVMYTALLIRVGNMRANLPAVDQFWWGFALLTLVVALAWWRRVWSIGGGLMAWFAGLGGLLLLGWRGDLLLGVSLLVIHAARRHAWRRRQALEVAEGEGLPEYEDGGRLGGALVTGAAGVGLFLAFLAFSTGVAGAVDPLHRLFAAAATGAWAAAVADLLARELGTVFGRTPILATTLKRVPVGTTGAISLQGTLLGAAGALALGLLALLCGLVPGRAVLFVTVAGALGSYAKSFLAASLSAARRPSEMLLLVIATALAGLTVILLAMLFS
jgi:uncharacterized protein (TIGR00297 family)